MTRNLGVYAKTIIAALLAATYALQAALSDNKVTSNEWVGIGIVALSTLGVWAVPNHDPLPPEPAEPPVGSGPLFQMPPEGGQ